MMSRYMASVVRLSLFGLATVIGSTLSGCSSLVDKHVEWETVEPESYPVLTAIGYAPIGNQHGETDSARSLMAMRASKLDAYRELAEQVYGQRIAGRETLANLVVDNTQLQASVEGVIRGAKVIKSYPVGEDTYATELELDMQRVYDIYLTTAKPQRIKQVKYY
ncbi:LPP20 family lipoprotein [Alteromonas salexigens]